MARSQLRDGADLRPPTGKKSYQPSAGRALGLATPVGTATRRGPAFLPEVEALETRLAPTVSFAAPQIFAEGGGSPVVADFNGDGRPDIAGVTVNNVIAVLVNTTQAGATVPTFAPPQTFAVGSVPVSVAAADFNGDGKPDLAVLNGTVSVLLNTTAPGSSVVTFAPQQAFGADSQGVTVVAGDLNGDGRPDLAVSNGSLDAVSVLLNTTAAGAGTPSFAAPQSFAVGSYAVGLALGDLNGDGRPDIVVTNSNDSTVSVLVNKTTAGASTSTFAAQQTFSVGVDPFAVAVEDFNGDGRPDLAVVNTLDNTVSVLLNSTTAGASTISFAAQQTFAVGTEPVRAAVGDFDADGRPDLVVVNTNGNGPATVSVLVNTTNAGASVPSFAAQRTFSVGINLGSVAVADFNGDGRPDLAVANNEGLSVLLNTTGSVPVADPQMGTAAPAKAKAITLTGSGPSNDPLLFAVAANPSHGTLSGFNGATGVITYTPAAGYIGPDSFQFTVTDTTTGLTSSPATVSLTIAPPVYFAPLRTFATGGSSFSVAVADFNDDGRPDIVVPNEIDGTVSVLLNSTAAGADFITFAAQQTFAVGGFPSAVVAADFNGDGKPDLAVTNNVDNTVTVLLNTTPAGSSTLSFAAPRTFAVGNAPMGMAVGDFNGDGRPDLVIANEGRSGMLGDSVSVLVDTTPAGAGTVSFAAQQTFAVGTLPVALAVGDFNGDGRPDIAVVVNSPSAVSVLLNTTPAGAPAITFASQQTFPVVITPTPFRWAISTGTAGLISQS